MFIKGKPKAVLSSCGHLTHLFSQCVPHQCYQFELQSSFGNSNSLTSVGTSTMKAVKHTTSWWAAWAGRLCEGGLSQGLMTSWCRLLPHRYSAIPSGNRLYWQPPKMSQVKATTTSLTLICSKTCHFLWCFGKHPVFHSSEAWLLALLFSHCKSCQPAALWCDSLASFIQQYLGAEN